MIYIDNVAVEFGKFPNGESNLNFNKIQFWSTSIITLKYESDADLFNLYILKSYIDGQMPNNTIWLSILYMPYSRMDRENDVYTFNLKYICNFINSLNFFRVDVYDAHSDVTLALLDRCNNVSIIPSLVSKFKADHPEDIKFFYPDAGAQKRYSDSFGYDYCVGFKSRNFDTGNITKYEILGDGIEGNDFVIIDDLCSKGGTFIGAAKALKERGAKNIYLIVAHCEDNIFKGEIFSMPWGPIINGGYIKEVYTTNSILRYASYRTSDLKITKLI